MKTVSGMISLFCFAVLVVLGGCGGGGSTATTQAAAVSSKATVKFSTQGTLAAGTQLAGIGVTVTLPAGVTVSTDAGGAVAAGVVTITGVAAQSGVAVVGPAVYTPAAGATRGTLTFTIAAGNFGVGEFATVNFILAPGASAPVAADIAITPADQTLQPVPNLTVALSVALS